MVIVKRIPATLTDEELALCREHNLQEEGEMLFVLEQVLQETRHAIVYLMYESLDFVGWSIIFDEWTGPERGKTVVHVFIRYEYRRNGYGSKLLAEVHKDNEMTRLEGLPHDLPSYRFYARHLDKVHFNINDAVYSLPKEEFDTIAAMMV